MRDSKAGAALRAVGPAALLWLALAAGHLCGQDAGAAVDYIMPGILLLSVALTARRGARWGAAVCLSLSVALAVACSFLWPERLLGLVFWLIWSPGALLLTHKACAGVRGLLAERDFYRGESARTAMIDPVTQMRNTHAFLNDAPIYIKIARRYDLSMMVLAVRLDNADLLRRALGDVMFNELLEAISRLIHLNIRLEDLAYLVDSETGLWAISMFTHPDAIGVVIGRLRRELGTLVPRGTQGEPCAMSFSCGHALYTQESDPTSAVLLQQAIDSIQ